MNEVAQHHHHSHHDTSDLASAVGAAAAAQELGLNATQHYQLQQPDFGQGKDDNGQGVGGQGGHESLDDVGVHVHGLDIPTEVGDDDLDLGLAMGMDGVDEGHTPHDLDIDGGLDGGQRSSYGRPPSIRKACDLCHAAKQKCSGDRPTCTRCAAGGWQCVYAPRQRRRTVPKDQRGHSVLDLHQQNQARVQSHIPQIALALSQAQNAGLKKRKLGQRDVGFGEGLDMQRAIGMAMDMGLTQEEEGEEMESMNDEQMLESIAIDGYLADLPLATFVHNLPYVPPPPPENHVTFNPEDFPADMDQHTTSALREAIFSLHESSGGGGGHTDNTGEHQEGDGGVDGNETVDPHLALLDLSMPGDENPSTGDPTHGINLGNLPGFTTSNTCSHPTLVPHILSLLTQQPLEPKPGSNTPLTLSVFSPLARSLRLFNTLISCPNCSSSPHQTLPQLALLSRTTTILTFPFPPINTSSGTTAQISVHGARLAGTGVSEAIEQHIVGVIWDSWRASVREVFAAFERKAQDVITQTALAGEIGDSGNSSETQRAGLMFQAMARLVTAMDEVEGN